MCVNNGNGEMVCAMAVHVDEVKSHQVQAANACFAPAGVGAGAMAEAREDVDIQEVMALCEREEQPEVVVQLVCSLRSGVYTVRRHCALHP